MCKYEMDPTSIVEVAERTRFCPQTDRQMDGRTDGWTDDVKPVYPPFQLHWSVGYNKANLRDLIAVTGLVISLKLDSNNSFFSLYDLEIRWMNLKNNRAPFLDYIKLCALFPSHQWIPPGVTIWKCSIQVKIGNFFVLRHLEIWQMIFKNNQSYFKLCVSLCSHWLIKTGVTVRKCQIEVKIGNFLSCVTLKSNGWPQKTKGQLFYATSSFEHHFIVIGQFKLKLQTRNAKFRWKSATFCPMRPWNLTDDLEK